MVMVKCHFFCNYLAVSHHDDLLYLFHIPPIAPLYTENDPEIIIMKRMINMWVTFAYEG